MAEDLADFAPARRPVGSLGAMAQECRAGGHGGKVWRGEGGERQGAGRMYDVISYTVILAPVVVVVIRIS